MSTSTLTTHPAPRPQSPSHEPAYRTGGSEPFLADGFLTADFASAAALAESAPQLGVCPGGARPAREPNAPLFPSSNRDVDDFGRGR